jgi:hypothetical protein
VTLSTRDIQSKASAPLLPIPRMILQWSYNQGRFYRISDKCLPYPFFSFCSRGTRATRYAVHARSEESQKRVDTRAKEARVRCSRSHQYVLLLNSIYHALAPETPFNPSLCRVPTDYSSTNSALDPLVNGVSDRRFSSMYWLVTIPSTLSQPATNHFIC